MSPYEGKSRQEMGKMLLEVANKYLGEKESMKEVEVKVGHFWQKWDSTDNSPLGIWEATIDGTLPAKFVEGFYDWVDMAPFKSLGLQITILETIEEHYKILR